MPADPERIQYLQHNGKRYFFGCSSVPSLDPLEGWGVMRYLERHGHLHPDLHVPPLAACACPPPAEATDIEPVEPPRLMRLYLNYEVRVCGPPAVDREFGTIDFFVLFDTRAIGEKTRKILFG